MTTAVNTRPRTASDAFTAANVSSQRWLVALLYCVLFWIAIYPVWSVNMPPLVDLPNNLARVHILSAWENTPALQENYDVNWAIRPNLAIDLLVTPLARIMSIYDAGRIFVSLTLLSILGGTLALRKVVVGRIGLWPVLTFLVLYNHALYWGFLNYLLTAGLSMLAFAGWIAMRDRPAWVRFAVFSSVAFLLFLGHIIALFVYGLTIVGYELWRHFRYPEPRARMLIAWSTALGQFFIPGILFLHWMAANQSAHNAITSYGGFGAKLVAIISPVHFAVPKLDLLALLFLGLVLVWSRSRRGLTFAPELKVPILFVLAAAILMPNLLSDVWGADFRLPTIVICMLIAAIGFERVGTTPERVIAGIAIAIFIGRTVLISQAWHDVDKNFDEFRRASAAIPAGSSLLVAADPADVPDGKPVLYEMLYWHIGALAVIERSAFYPTLFTGHTTVTASPRRRPIDSPSGTPLSRRVLAGSANPEGLKYKLGHELSRYNRIYWIGWPNTFDYLLSIRFENKENPYPQSLTEISEGSFFDLYRITK